MESRNPDTARPNTVRLAAWINEEPAIFLGCTAPEISSIAVAATALCMPLFGGIGWAAGSFPLAIGAAALSTLLCACAAVRILRCLKDGKPAHYYHLRAAAALARFGWRRRLVVRSGRWGLGRSW